ncbi:hypothetical protein P8452_12891 [Trifolium repens]|nr:hypothetical protein P8452_12891 [Trifolium repens]
MTTVKNDSDIESIDQEIAEETTHLDLSNSSIINNNKTMHADQKSTTNKRYIPLLVINYLLLFVGSLSSSLLSKYYFIHKGSSRWVSTWVQSSGFPLLIFPIFSPFYLFQSTKRKPFSDFNSKMLTLSVSIGVMLGINNLFFSWGNSYLPVSTSALLLSSNLVFNLVLSVIIVKQKITFSNLNCVILLTLSSILLALDSSHEKPNGLSKKQYFIGYFCTISAGLLFALYLPVMEKVYKEVYCYEMVMEMQLIMEVAATALASVGMAWDGGFCFMGTAGMVFLTSSLTGGICMTALLSMNVLGGVLVFKDEFDGVKAVSTFLCLWGFCSYVYGMYVKMLEEKSRMRNLKSESSTEMIFMGNYGVTD